MPNRKHTLSLLLFIFFAFSFNVSEAQKLGYIAVGDTAYTDGYIHFDTKKPAEVEYRTTLTATPTVFNTEQLTEFGFHDSTKFQAKYIPYQQQTQKLFVQVIAEGNLKLYLLRNKEEDIFYIQKDSIERLEKGSFKSELLPFSGKCPNKLWQLDRVRFTKPSLSYYGKLINTGSCATVPIPSIGFTAGLGSTSLQFSQNAYSGNIFGKYSIATTSVDAGIYIETPLWVKKNLFFASHLSFSTMKFTDSRSTKTVEATHSQDIELNLSLLKFNILPKYYIISNKISFYVEAGPELAYVLNQSGDLFQARSGSGKAETKTTKDFLQTSTLKYGLTAGTGILYYYAPKQYFSIGINASQAFGGEHKISSITPQLRFNL